MKKGILLSAVLIAFLWPLCAQAEITYKVIDLGTLRGKLSCANSINNASQIVGWAHNSQGYYRATLFDPTGAGNNIDLGTLGGDESEALSINDADQIVGWAEYIPDYWQDHATLFDPTGAGNNIDLGTFTILVYYWSLAFSNNNANQIVGWADGYAILFDPTGAGNNIGMGALGGNYSEAFSINDAGLIVGRAKNSQGDLHATLFDPTGAGNNIDLGTLGGERSTASSINNAGQIVGNARNSQGKDHATLFDPTGAGNNIDLGTLGGDESLAHSINDADQIVGWADNNQGGTRATLFDPTGAGNNIDLNTLIDPNIGWKLLWANDINSSGWIVGYGRNPEGESHAFLLVPKQPCLYALAGDLNDDCKVDFDDFAVMVANWLVDCEAEPTDPVCVQK